jgi:hypothetical protein
MVSYGDGIVLMNPVLAGFLMFLLSFFEIPKEARKKLDFYM